MQIHVSCFTLPYPLLLCLPISGPSPFSPTRSPLLPSQTWQPPPLHSTACGALRCYSLRIAAVLSGVSRRRKSRYAVAAVLAGPGSRSQHGAASRASLLCSPVPRSDGGSSMRLLQWPWLATPVRDPWHGSCGSARPGSRPPCMASASPNICGFYDNSAGLVVAGRLVNLPPPSL